MKQRSSELKRDRVHRYSVEPWVWIPPSLPEAIDPEEVWGNVADEAEAHGMSHLKSLEEHTLRMLKAVEGGFANKLLYYGPDVDEKLARLPTNEGRAVLKLKLSVVRVMMDDWAYRGRISDWSDVSRQVSPRKPQSRFEEYLQTAARLLREGWEFDTKQSLWKRIAKETPREDGKVVAWESVYDSLQSNGAYKTNCSQEEVRKNILRSATELRLI